MPKEIIYILQNSFWGENVKTSGGDVRFVSIFRRIQDRFSPKSLIFVNKEGLSFDNGYGLNFDYLTTPLFFDKLGVFFSYTLRTIFVIYKLFFLPRNDIF